MKQNLDVHSQRIQIIDIIRGVAVLGIFSINIQDMAFPEDLVFVYNSISYEKDINYWLGITFETFFSGKMRGIFTILFGISSILIIEKLTTGYDGLKPADIYFRRLLWLMFFGLMHSYIFLWWGEVLFKYALLGMILFSFRRASNLVLCIAALICMSALTVQPYLEYREMVSLQHNYTEAQIRQNTASPLNSEDQKIIQKWQESLADMRPDQESIREEIEIKTGGYAELFIYNSGKVLEENTTIFYKEDLWDMILYMLVGIILFRIQFFNKGLTQHYHLAIACFGIGIGVAVHSWMILGVSANNLDPVKSRYYLIFFDLGRLPFVLGYISLIIFSFRMETLRYVGDRMAAVGKMAMSNYLIQSIIGAIIFYGFGLAQFNELSRVDVAVTIILVWIFQIAFSVVWLAQFNYGPFEWIWRSLTYWRAQPFYRS